MNRLLFSLLVLVVHLSLFGGTTTVYDILGSSDRLDANSTYSLDKWRYDTITPVREGHYANVVVNGDPQSKNISLTFDDSPDENNTGRILEILKRYNVQASFFMIASPMNDVNATVVTRASDEGHLVLNHSFTHPHLTQRSDAETVRELHGASERIEALTGHYPMLVRPPYGSVDSTVIDTINAQGYTTVLWSLDSLDWAVKEKGEIVRNVVTNIRPGDIILMHSGKSNYATVEALPEIIERLRGEGYAFLRLDAMLGIHPYRQ